MVIRIVDNDAKHRAMTQSAIDGESADGFQIRSLPVFNLSQHGDWNLRGKISVQGLETVEGLDDVTEESGSVSSIGVLEDEAPATGHGCELVIEAQDRVLPLGHQNVAELHLEVPDILQDGAFVVQSQ